ncbi:MULTISPECIES: GntR family transcriptional regulator [unclassified Mycolicibacterium]|uniref:GntR family transcriptional regulator n=1 Tax=unclassified Mycolicibacterium TaxID=2636767 RepID=UPI002EDAB5AB
MGPSALPPVPTASRGQRVARTLREAITNGSLLPGQRLLETDLAQNLGTSNGPVREALALLETEGLVVKAPYRGAVVAEVGQDEIEQVLVPVRVVIERFAFAEAAPQLTADDFASLDGLVEQMRAAADRGDTEALAEADIAFHELVIARSRHNHCLQLWRIIQPRVRAYFRRDALAHRERYAVADQHQRLIGALKTNKTEELLAAVDEHIHTHFGPDHFTQ